MVGILLVDKPQGISSHSVVFRVKRALGVRKAGHTGTLDPLATGILPVALGEATKIIPFLDESKKVYEVTGILGQSTDTFDADGKLLREEDPGNITQEDIKALIPQFVGSLDQIPPIFSAIKVKGRPTYRLARQGKEVSLPPRKIIIHSIELLSFRSPHFSLKVRCSRGTYIRSLVHDMGQALGPGAHVAVLRRLQSGPFGQDQALSLEQILEGGDLSPEVFWSIERCLEALPWLSLESEEELQRVRSGVALYRLQEALGAGDWEGKTVLLKFRNKVIAVVGVEAAGNFRFLRVLRSSN